MVLDDPVRDLARLDLARPAHHHRDAEGALPVGVLLAAERRHAAVRPRVHVGTVVGRIHDESVVRDAELIEKVEHLADILVMVDHCVVIVGLPASRLSFVLGLGMGVEMHVGHVQPDKERLAGVVLALHEILGRRNKFVVAGFHALLGERAGIGHSLFSDLAPTRLIGRVVLVGRP